MRNLKKYLAVIVAIAVMMTAMIPAFAEETTTIPADAKICADLGVLKGSGDGVTAEYLAGSVDRMQAARLYLRLKGLEEEALATDEDAENFPDADETTADGAKIMAYLKANPQHGFAGGVSGNFGPNDQMEAQAYYKVLLTALGYSQKDDAGVGDFEYKDTFTFAASKGLSKVATVTDFTRADFAAASVEALKATVKGTTKTLVATLVDAGKIDKAAAIAAGLYTDVPTTFEVSSVTATNLKEIVVVFNQAVDETSAETASKYSTDVGSIKSVSLADDGMTATVLLADGVSMTSQTEYKISVTNVKSADKSQTITAKNIKFIPLDNELPTVTEVKSLGTKAIKVTVSEPVKTASSTLFKLDGNSYIGSIKTDSRTITLRPYNTSTSMTVGAHTLTVSKLEDYNSFKSLEQTIDFDVVADTAAPQIVDISATLEEVKITFDEDIDPDTVSTSDFYYKTSSSVKKYPTSATVDGTKITLDFSNNTLPAYATTLYIVSIADYSGNALASAEASVTATVDQERPEVSDVVLNEDNAKQIKVTYNKSVSGSVRANYVLKESDGDIVPLNTVASTSSKEYTLTYYNDIPSGTVTLTITGTQDTTTLKNTMLPYTVDLEVGDTTAPKAISALAGGRQVVITFDEEMDLSTLTNSKNYLIKYKKDGAATSYRALPDSTSITPTASGKAVIIVLPEKIDDVAVSASLNGSTNWQGIQVMGVEDLAENILDGYIKEFPFTATELGGIALATDYDDDHTGVNAVFTDKNTIKVRFNTPISSATTSDFSLTGTPITSPITDVITDDTDVVVLKLKDGVGTSVAGWTLQTATANITSVTGLKASSALGISIYDEVAPEAIDPQTLAVSGSTLALKFTETLNPANVAYFGNDLKVYRVSDTTTLNASKYTLTVGTTTKTNDTLFIRIAASEVKNSLYTVAIPSEATYIKDMQGNEALASDTFESASALAVDTTAPTVTGYALNVTGSGPETITLSFSEDIDFVNGAAVTGFSVSTGTIASAVYNATVNTVVITSAAQGDFNKSTTVSYTAGNVSDLAGVALLNITTQAVVGSAADTVAPGISIIALNENTTNPEEIKIIFNEPLNIANGANVAGFTTSSGTIASAVYDSATNAVIITSSADGEFTAATTIDYVPGNVADTSGNLLVAFTARAIG